MVEPWDFANTAVIPCEVFGVLTFKPRAPVADARTSQLPGIIFVGDCFASDCLISHLALGPKLHQTSSRSLPRVISGFYSAEQVSPNGDRSRR